MKLDMKPFHLSTVSRRDVVIWTKTSRFFQRSHEPGVLKVQNQNMRKRVKLSPLMISICMLLVMDLTVTYPVSHLAF